MLRTILPICICTGTALTRRARWNVNNFSKVCWVWSRNYGKTEVEGANISSWDFLGSQSKLWASSEICMVFMPASLLLLTSEFSKTLSMACANLYVVQGSPVLWWLAGERSGGIKTDPTSDVWQSGSGLSGGQSGRNEWRHLRWESADSDRWREDLQMGKTWHLRKGLWQNERLLKSGTTGGTIVWQEGNVEMAVETMGLAEAEES